VVTDVEKLLGDKKADLCFRDPPYNVDYAVGAERTIRGMCEISTAPTRMTCTRS